MAIVIIFFEFLKVYAKAGMRLVMTIINLNDTTVETPKVEGGFEGFLGYIFKGVSWGCEKVNGGGL